LAKAEADRAWTINPSQACHIERKDDRLRRDLKEPSADLPTELMMAFNIVDTDGDGHGLINVHRDALNDISNGAPATPGWLVLLPELFPSQISPTRVCSSCAA
jgi:hypothetical protein